MNRGGADDSLTSAEETRPQHHFHARQELFASRESDTGAAQLPRKTSLVSDKYFEDTPQSVFPARAPPVTELVRGEDDHVSKRSKRRARRKMEGAGILPHIYPGSAVDESLETWREQSTTPLMERPHRESTQTAKKELSLDGKGRRGARASRECTLLSHSSLVFWQKGKSAGKKTPLSLSRAGSLARSLTRSLALSARISRSRWGASPESDGRARDSQVREVGPGGAGGLTRWKQNWHILTSFKRRGILPKVNSTQRPHADVRLFPFLHAGEAKAYPVCDAADDDVGERHAFSHPRAEVERARAGPRGAIRSAVPRGVHAKEDSRGETPIYREIVVVGLERGPPGRPPLQFAAVCRPEWNAAASGGLRIGSR